MKEIKFKEMKFNPFNLIGGEWMLVTAGDERLRVGDGTSGMNSCNTMTASWGHQENGFLYQDTIDANYPQRDFHTMYIGKIEKVLVRDDEYLNN